MTRDDKVAYNYARERLDNDDYPVYSDEYELECAFKAGIENAKQWISVEDELPPKPSEYEELSIVVLATDGEEVYKGVYMSGEYLNGWFTPDMWELKNITHWMSLPQPPREVRGNQRKISPNQQQIIGTPEHIKTALDVIDKKGSDCADCVMAEYPPCNKGIPCCKCGDECNSRQPCPTHWMPLPQPSMEIRGNQRKISPNQQQIIGTPEHIKTALDVMDKKGGEK